MRRVELKNRFRLGSEYESGGAGLISCADDYILFANALCNGGSTAAGRTDFEPTTIDLMRTNHLDAVVCAISTGRILQDTDMGSAYGRWWTARGAARSVRLGNLAGTVRQAHMR